MYLMYSVFQLALIFPGIISTWCLFFVVMTYKSLSYVCKTFMFFYCLGCNMMNFALLYVAVKRIINKQDMDIEKDMYTTDTQIAYTVHESGFAMSCIAIFALACDRFIAANQHKYHQFSGALFLTVAAGVLIVLLSLLFGYVIHYEGVLILPTIGTNLAQIMSFLILMVAMRKTRNRYQREIGNELEYRYQTADYYYMSRALLRVAASSAIAKFLSQAFIWVLITSEICHSLFGPFNYAYQCILSLHIACIPWVIILRKRRRIYCSGDSTRVEDLDGKILKGQITSDEHFAHLAAQWR